MPKPRPINYIIYAGMVSIGFGSVIFSAVANQASPALGMLICFAVCVLRWQHFREPIKWQIPRLQELISAAVFLLFLVAFVLFFASVRQDAPDVLIKHFWNNKPFLACLWGAMLIAPLREMLGKSEKRETGITEPSPGAYSSKAADDLTENAQE